MYKNDFCWNRGGSLFKKPFDIKNRFCTDKGKKIQSHATPTRKEVYVAQSLLVNLRTMCSQPFLLAC